MECSLFLLNEVEVRAQEPALSRCGDMMGSPGVLRQFIAVDRAEAEHSAAPGPYRAGAGDRRRRRGARLLRGGGWSGLCQRRLQVDGGELGLAGHVDGLAQDARQLLRGVEAHGVFSVQLTDDKDDYHHQQSHDKCAGAYVNVPTAARKARELGSCRLSCGVIRPCCLGRHQAALTW